MAHNCNPCTKKVGRLIRSPRSSLATYTGAIYSLGMQNPTFCSQSMLFQSPLYSFCSEECLFSFGFGSRLSYSSSGWLQTHDLLFQPSKSYDDEDVPTISSFVPDSTPIPPHICLFWDRFPFHSTGWPGTHYVTSGRACEPPGLSLSIWTAIPVLWTTLTSGLHI